jgi:dihydropteroate synthase
VTTSVPGLPQADRCLVVAVLNVTPDSFSDGGRYASTTQAVRRGAQLLAEGADMVDVGGESTRPGADRVDAAEERRRVVPVVAALAADGARVTVDTTRSEVAAAALEAGAAAVNDVSGGLADPRMLPLVARAGVPVVLMHWRGPSRDMQSWARYDDVLAEVTDHLVGRAEAARAAGVAPDKVVLDPGLGFAKTAAHNWALLHDLPRLVGLGYPVLVGASRKSFLGDLLAAAHRPRPVADREDATTAVSALAAAAGAWAVRVHEPRPSADAVRVAAAWRDRGAVEHQAVPGED